MSNTVNILLLSWLHNIYIYNQKPANRWVDPRYKFSLVRLDLSRAKYIPELIESGLITNHIIPRITPLGKKVLIANLHLIQTDEQDSHEKFSEPVTAWGDHQL